MDEKFRLTLIQSGLANMLITIDMAKCNISYLIPKRLYCLRCNVCDVSDTVEIKLTILYCFDSGNRKPFSFCILSCRCPVPNIKKTVTNCRRSPSLR